LVDTDPQCNLTAYLIEGSVVDDLLDHSDDNDGKTIWSALKPVVEGTGFVRKIPPFSLPEKNLLLTPGDIRLSDFEAELSSFWAECLQRKARGYRGTTAISELVSELCFEKNIDFVFYDSGPNIGALNRVILLDCDFFVVPVACDLFSVRALKTLGRTLASWISEWETIASLAPDGTYLLPGEPKFLGYIPQNFSLYRGEVVSQQSRYLSLIERSMRVDIVAVLKKIRQNAPVGPATKLGDVKDFGMLVTASQREGRPIDSVSAGTPAQRSVARTTFHNIARKIIERVG
jgi:cellulose biosynthesis protein BcsQ